MCAEKRNSTCTVLNILKEIKESRQRIQRIRRIPHTVSISILERGNTLCNIQKYTVPPNVLEKANRVIEARMVGKEYVPEKSNLYIKDTDMQKDMRPFILKKRFILLKKYTDITFTNIERECSICLEAYRKVSVCGILSCNHIFHRSCIYSCLKHTGACPICRKDVISGIVNSSR